MSMGQTGEAWGGIIWFVTWTKTWAMFQVYGKKKKSQRINLAFAKLWELHEHGMFKGEKEYHYRRCRKVSISQVTYDMSNNHRKALEEFERGRVWSDVHGKGAAQWCFVQSVGLLWGLLVCCVGKGLQHSGNGER